MDSIKNFIDETNYKNSIYELIREMFPHMEPKEGEKLSTEVYEKVNKLNNMTNELDTSTIEYIKALAKEHGTSEESIITSYVYFTLVIDNVLLEQAIAYQNEIIGELGEKIEKLEDELAEIVNDY